MNKVTWSIFIALVIGTLGSLIFIARTSSSKISQINPYVIQLASDENGQIADHVYGLSDSKVILIEYGDYQCSGCSITDKKIKSFIEKYKNKISFVFRNYPLYSSYPNSKAASSAVEAAGLQGKYWEMHTKIYEVQSEWTNLSSETRTAKFLSYAQELGLSETKFKADMASSEVSKKISFDYALGQKSGITETPSFFLNGHKIDSAIWGDLDKFSEALDKALAK